MIDYTSPPTYANLASFLSSVGLGPLAAVIAGDFGAMYLASATASIQRDCDRQFVPSAAGVVRSFDGSGTGLQFIDDAVSVTAVSYLIFPQSTGVQVQGWIPVSEPDKPIHKLQIYQGPSGVSYGFRPFFPEGRHNISVTATWGYAASIPVDVWEAILLKAASGAVNSNVLSQRGGGSLTSWKDDDVQEDYDPKTLPSVIAGWDMRIAHIVDRYRRSITERYQRLSAPIY